MRTAPSRPHAPRDQAQLASSRPGFTLVELLVVIVIIGMLAGMSLGALYSARESARIGKTRSTIAKLDVIVQARMDEFASRRLPIRLNVKSKPDQLPLPRDVRIRFTAEARLRALRKLQQWEMPDRLEDIASPRTTGNDAFVASDINVPWTFEYTKDGQTWTLEMQRTAVARSMFRRCATQLPTPTSGATTPEENADVAEVLYMWITAGDREAVEGFQADEIGDTDNDGYPEFIDAWGEPIRFIRWPTGFTAESDLMSGDPENDHDPLDTRRIDPAAFRTIPLIYSKGPDKTSGLNIETGATSYEDIYDPNKSFGVPVDSSHDQHDAHFDNIHNHSLGMN